MSVVDTDCIGLEVGTRVRVFTAIADEKNKLGRKSRGRGKCYAKHKALTDSKGLFSGVVLKETKILLKQDETDSTRKQNQVLALSLSRNSPPFSAGQVVWIKGDKIKMITLIDD